MACAVARLLQRSSAQLNEIVQLPPPLLPSPLTVSSGLVMLISPNRNSIEEIEADIINIFVALHSLLRNNIRQMLDTMKGAKFVDIL